MGLTKEEFHNRLNEPQTNQNLPPVRIFYSYAREDLEYLETLRRYLKVPMRQGYWTDWYDQKTIVLPKF